MKLKLATAALALGCFVFSVSAAAAETTKYTYDAKGRLVKVERSGTVNNNVKTDYEHDRADNRKRVKTTGSTNPG